MALLIVSYLTFSLWMLLKNVNSPEESVYQSICVCLLCACVQEVKDCERTAGFKISIRVIDAGVGEEGGHVCVSLKIAQRSGEEEFPPIEPCHCRDTSPIAAAAAAAV